MTHVNFLFHRLLVSQTETDRQTRQICNRYQFHMSWEGFRTHLLSYELYKDKRCIQTL